MSLLLLIIAFVTTGIGGILNKMLVSQGLSNYIDLYLLAFYGIPLLIGAASNTVQKQKYSRQDVGVGLLMGFAGMVGAVFMMLALSGMKGIIVFPVRNLGNVVLTGFVSILIWKERLSKTQWLGIIISLVAIMLIY